MVFGLGGDNVLTGREMQLPEYISPQIGGAGFRFGDNNAQMPYVLFNTPAPYLDITGPAGDRTVSARDTFDGAVPFEAFAGPSGQVGLLPNLSFLYGTSTDDLRLGTHPGLAPRESGFNPLLANSMQYMSDAVPALTPFTTDALFGIRDLLTGNTNLPGQGAIDYFTGLPAPVYARGHNPLYTAGLGALGGAGRMLPTMLDPSTEGARRAALSGTVPVGTYQPLIEDIERRGAERQADLTREFEEDIAPGLVQRLATGQANYGSAGERMANRLARTYGEQQRRIEEDVSGDVTALHSQAARDALQRQYGAMGTGISAAQNIFGTGGNIMGQQAALEQAAMGSALDRSLRAAQLGTGTGLEAYRLGLGSLPSTYQAALGPIQQLMGAGSLYRDIENNILADRIATDPLNVAYNDLQRFGALLGLAPMPGPVQLGTSSSSDLASIGALLSGAGALAGSFAGGPVGGVLGGTAGNLLANAATGYPQLGGGSVVSGNPFNLSLG